MGEVLYRKEGSGVVVSSLEAIHVRLFSRECFIGNRDGNNQLQYQIALLILFAMLR